MSSVNGADHILKVEEVSAAYGTYRALFGVSLCVERGGVVALLGANGAGKSTVARVISGLVPVSSGRVIFDGTDVTKLEAHEIARLGLTHVPEGRGVFGSLTVEENLTVAFRQKVKRKGLAQALERAYGAFPVLAERRRQLAGTLSGGQQRILSLAKVLAVPSKLLVVDELSFGLAPVIVDAVYEGLADIHRSGTAVLVVEQHIDRALSFAHHAVVLSKGKVAWSGDPAQARAAMERVLHAGSVLR